MTDIAAVLEKLLRENPGPVSIAAGIEALRRCGVTQPAVDLQAVIGTFAARRGRAIRFDLRHQEKETD